jgi:hypothetical protein
VLFSVDCATGLFDNETAGGDYGTTNGGVYLLEALLRQEGGGVVGTLGDTRNSPTWANNALTRGFSDAVFPDVLPSYGGTNSIRRLADILNYGKLYMFSQVGVSQTAGSVSQTNADSNNVMWHAFGDPTQEVWTRVPLKVLVRFALEALSDRFVIRYEMDGTVITAMQNGVPVGRGTVINGEAVLEFVTEPEDGVPIDLSASKEGYVAARLTGDSPEPNELESEKDFSAKVTRITFDPDEGRRAGEVVTDQYEKQGVAFLSSRTLSPVILDDRTRDAETQSDGQSLRGVVEFPSTSRGVPLGIQFVSDPVRRVGMYVGNGDGRLSSATLTAFDARGQEIYTASRRLIGSDVTSFIGLDAGTSRIAAVALSYGDSSAEEEIDDLLFE